MYAILHFLRGWVVCFFMFEVLCIYYSVRMWGQYVKY